MAENLPTPVGFGQVLRNRQFRALWLAQTVSGFGDFLAIMALFSLVAFRWQGTPRQVGGIFISFIIPAALLGPVAGVFVDRWDIKRTMIASDLIRAVVVVLLAFATSLSQLYLLMFALSAVSCFFMPAQAVAIPRLVDKQELLVANALNSQTMNLNKVISPAVAGALVAWAGERLCFFIDGASFLFSAALLALVALPHTPPAPRPGLGAVFADLREGLRFIVHHRALLFLISSMMAAIFALGAFDALIAVYVRDVLASQSQIFGAILSLSGVGTILGSLLIGRFGQRQSRLRLVVLGILTLGLSVGVLAALARVWVTLACSLGFGLGVAGVLVPAQTLIQEETPPSLLGRVSSTNLSLITLSQLVSISISGTVANWIGIRNLYLVVALALVLIAAVGFFHTRDKQG